MQEKRLQGIEGSVLEKMVVPLVLVNLILFSVFCKIKADAKIIDKIVAVVNEEIITLSELRKISAPYLEKMKVKFSLNYDEEQIKETERRVLDQLIDDKLVNQEADRLEIVIGEKEVDLAIRDVRESSNLSEDQFIQALLEEGITLEKYREQIENEMRKMRLLEQEIKSKAQIKENEIEEYYQKHLDDFKIPPEVRLQQILLMIPPKVSEQEVSQIREKAEEIVQKIRDGEDFTAMVRLYSQGSSAAAGGDMGFFKEDELIPVINKVAFSLKAGEVSSVIQTPLGFCIIRVLEKREKQKMTEEERRKEIENIIYNQKVEDKFKQWIKELRKRSFVQINL